MDFVISHKCYELNVDNLNCVVQYLNHNDKQLILTYESVQKTGNEDVIGYVNENVMDSIKLFKDDMKSLETCMKIINEMNDINPVAKKNIEEWFRKRKAELESLFLSEESD